MSQCGGPGIKNQGKSGIFFRFLRKESRHDSRKEFKWNRRKDVLLSGIALVVGALGAQNRPQSRRVRGLYRTRGSRRTCQKRSAPIIPITLSRCARRVTQEPLHRRGVFADCKKTALPHRYCSKSVGGQAPSPRAWDHFEQSDVCPPPVRAAAMSGIRTHPYGSRICSPKYIILAKKSILKMSLRV